MNNHAGAHSDRERIEQAIETNGWTQRAGSDVGGHVGYHNATDTRRVSAIYRPGGQLSWAAWKDIDESHPVVPGGSWQPGLAHRVVAFIDGHDLHELRKAS